MKDWIFILSIIFSLFIGIKFRSKCCGKDCEVSIDKEESETTNEVLRTITIGRVSKSPTKKLSKENTELELETK